MGKSTMVLYAYVILVTLRRGLSFFKMRRKTQRSKRPIRTKRRKPYRKTRTTIRRRLGKGWRVTRFRAPLGNFPNTKTVALRYVENITLDGGSGSTAVNVFRVNSIYDPNYTGVGHQPMFRDNYAAIYEDYRVNYSTITMVALGTHVVNTTTAETTAGTTVGANQFYASAERACRMFIIRDKSATDYNADLDTLIEEGNTNMVWRFCPQNTSAYMPKLRMGCWPHRLLGLTKKDDTLRSVVSGSPAGEAYFVCGVTDLGYGNPDSMTFQFIITYNVTFMNLIKNQTQN